MKYYLIEITTKENKVEKAIYEYSSNTEAVANFHSKLGGAMKNADYLAEMLQVIDERGGVVIYDYYAKQTAEPEPEPEA